MPGTQGRSSPPKGSSTTIAVYGTVQSWAERLDDQSAASLLQRTLDEEKAADRKLTEIAERSVNKGGAWGDELQN
jgi:ferritin-like metal-binding protein YciE